nr:MAG TPA: hypothetical protein [Bacteriophage sp.]
MPIFLPKKLPIRILNRTFRLPSISFCIITLKMI